MNPADIIFLWGLLGALKAMREQERRKFWRSHATQGRIDFLDIAVKELEHLLSKLDKGESDGGQNNDHREQEKQAGSKFDKEVL